MEWMLHRANGDIYKTEWHHQSPAHSTQPEALDQLLVLRQDTVEENQKSAGLRPLKSGQLNLAS